MPENGTKYDWFKNELVGNTANFADMYQDGKMPEQFKIKSVDDYWNDEQIRKPFEDKWGPEEGKKEFDKTYKSSVDRYDAYRQGRFDITSTSEKRMLPTQFGKRAAALGLTKLYNNPQIQIPDVSRDIEGRDIVAGIYSRPEYSWRQGAIDNGVYLEETGKFIDFDTFRETDGRPLVYAVDNDSRPSMVDGKTYVRPLNPGEEIKAHEEYATKFSDYLGLNGLETPDWYALKFAPKNIANFAADILDSGSELLKSIDRITMDRDDDPSDAYNSLTDFQNMIGSYLHGSTSDVGRQDWTTTEGLVDGISQVVLQLGGMFGVAGTTGSVLRATKMASEAGSLRAASVASRMFMSTLAADGLAKQAKTANLSPKEIAAIHGLSLLGYYKIAKLSEWVIGTNPAIQKHVMDSVILRELGNWAKAAKVSGLNTKGIMQLSKNITNGLDKAVRNTMSNPNAIAGYVGAGALESLEEVSESLMELGIKETYDKIYQPLFGTTSIARGMDTNQDARFNTDYTTLASELAQAATLGFVGGGIGRTFFRGSGNERKNYYKYLASGQFPEVKRRLEILYKKGALGDPALDAEGNPVADGKKSRNDLAYEAIRNDMKIAESFWNSKGLNNAYDTTEKKLSLIGAIDLKDTSIGHDLATAIDEINVLQEQKQELLLDKDGDREQELKKVEKDIETQVKEIDAIRNGNRATKYLHESLYRINPPNTEFKTYYNLNEELRKTLSTRKSQIETMEKAKKIANLDNLEEFSVLDEETGERLKKEAEKKYAPQMDEETGEIKTFEEQLDIPEAIDKKVEKGKNLPNPASDILSNFDGTFKATDSFSKIVENEKAREKELRETGKGIYDNVENLSTLRNNLQARVEHLAYSQIYNPTINEAHEKLEDNLEEIIFTPDEIKQAAFQLEQNIADLDILYQIAKDNRFNFEKAVQKANDAAVNYNIDELNSVIDLFNIQDEALIKFDDKIRDEINADLISIQNIDDSSQKQRIAYQIQKKIHDYFSNDQEAILQVLYDLYGITNQGKSVAWAYNNFATALGIDRNGQIVDRIKKTDSDGNTYYLPSLRYLKMIITLDPKVFATHYSKILQNIPEEVSTEKAYTKARHILSPAQRHTVQHIVAALEDNNTKANLNVRSEDSRSYEATEGIFLTSPQGSGKTITAATAAVVRQKISGGKILVVANDKINHKNMADTIEGLGGKLDPTVVTSFAELKSHLASNKQGDINTIIYDEATLVKANQIFELDLLLRQQINSKRAGGKLKVIYAGDKSQIGAGTETADFNIATNVSIETTNEMQFSYRTGNDQINNALEHARAITMPKKEGTSFSSKYSIKDVFSGAWFADQDFDKAMGQVMQKMNPDDDFVVITEFEKISEIREKYDLADLKVLTPEQAQGKQWDYVIVDLNTTKIVGPLDSRRKKRFLSSVGRAKQFILARVDNTNAVEGITMNMHSTEGDSVWVDVAISEEARINAKKEQIAMLEGLDLQPIKENTDQGSQETVEIVDIVPEEIVDEIKEKPLDPVEKKLINNIIEKLKQFPKSKGVTSDQAYIMQHGYYSYAQSYDADGNLVTLTDTSQILALKNRLLYPQPGDDIDVSFSLMIHANEMPSKIINDPGDNSFDPNQKKLVIYATIFEGGKPAYKVSMGALNKVSDLGLSQSDLFNVEIPFTETQNQKYKAALISSQDFKNLSEEDKANSVIVDAPSYRKRKFEMQTQKMSVEEFIKINSNLWNFATDLIYTSAAGKQGVKKDSAEKQTWLVYSPTKTTQELDKIIRFNQPLIDAEGSDIKKVAVDGGRVIPIEEGYAQIEKYYDTESSLRPQVRHLLPEITPTRVTAIFDYISKQTGVLKYDPDIDNKFQVSANIQKKLTKGVSDKEQKMLLNAMQYAFFDRTKAKAGGYNKIERKGAGYEYVRDLSQIPEKNLSFSVNRFIHYLTERTLRKDQELAELADKLRTSFANQVFPNGFYYEVRPKEGETESHNDRYAIADASISDYSVNLKHPSMPVHKIKFDFFKDVLSNDDVLSVKIATKTDFESYKKAIADANDNLKSSASPIQVSEFVIDKNLEGNERSKDADLFSEKAKKATMYDLFRIYFNEKPYNSKISDFVKYYEKKIYNSIFNLSGNNPEIVQDDVDAALKELKKGLKANGSIIDSAVEAIKESGRGTLDRKKLLGADGYAEIYYDYIIAKEFDSLLDMKFPYINIDGGKYRFNNKQYKENQLIDNKEKVSHIERGNNLVKMHLFNMPIYKRRIFNGEEILMFDRYGDQRLIAKLVRSVKGVNISDPAEAEAFFESRKTDEELYSFYKRFLDPNKFEARNSQNAFEDSYSFSAIRKINPNSSDIAEDTVTGVLSFIASGNEAEYVNIDIAEEEINARFIDIPPSRFRDDLQLAIQSVGSESVQAESKRSYKIFYGKDNKDFVSVDSSGKMNFTGRGDFDIGKVLLALNLPGINSRQYEDVLNFETPSTPNLTGRVLFEIAKYLSNPIGERGQFMRGKDLTEWNAWTERFQNLKTMDSAYGYTNLAGDKVNLISLSYPLSRTQQKVDSIAKNPASVLRRNPFVTKNLTIDSYLLKEGYKGKISNRANSKMTENEQMDYDFRHLYLKSLLKGSIGTQSVIFNPMVFADKSTDAVLRVSGQFLPVTSNGEIDVNQLKKRAIASISEYNVDVGKAMVDTFIKAFDEVGIKHKIVSVRESSNAGTVKARLNEINSVINKTKQSKRNLLTRTGLVKNFMYQTSKGNVVSGIKQGFINYITPEDITGAVNNAHRLFKQQYKTRKNLIPDSEINAFKKLGIVANIDNLLDSYFYNHIYVAQNYSQLMAGSVWQYKNAEEYGDQIKRNSQITTNRQKFVLRRSGYDVQEHGLKHGRKLGKFSKTAIVTDIPIGITAINYEGLKAQEVFDGAAFHNIYAMLQMQESYGNDLGFNVAPTLKPISSYVNELTGHSRFDKYASFLISEEILENGEPFIKKMHDLMLKSVEFNKDEITDLDNTPIVGGIDIIDASDGTVDFQNRVEVAPKNLYELEQAIKIKMTVEAQQTSAEQGTEYVEPSYIDVVKRTLDVMVFNGVQDNYIQEVIFDSSVKTGVSNLNNINFDNYNQIERLESLDRSNEERGLVLDSSHDPSEYDGAFPTQVASAVLQGNFSTAEANNLLRAIKILGDKVRSKAVGPDYHKTVKNLLKTERINKRGDIGLIHSIVNQNDYSANNKTVMGQLFSTMTSTLSRSTIAFRIKGGQQVVAPSYGVFNHPDENRELRGFDAFNASNVSIKQSHEWQRLVELVDNKESNELIQEARAEVHRLISTEYTTVQQPEVILAPTMFRNFEIPKGTRSIKEIEQGFAEGLYKGTWEDFQKTLTAIVLRIPSTNKQSFMAAKIVGFANDSANTFYTNIDLLYLQGADQDIDKGNILTFEMEKGRINIPTDKELSINSSEIDIKNYIVQQFINASLKPSTLMETSMPTGTATLKELSLQYQDEINKNVHWLNPFSLSTMFVRGQGGKANIGIHAVGLKTYSSIYHSLKKKGNGNLFGYVAKSTELGKRVAEVRGLESPDSLGYFETMSFFSELINAATDNGKDPILGALGINGATGNLVNALAILGYTPKQVVDFLHNKDVMKVVADFEEYQEFSLEYKPLKTLTDFAENAAFGKASDAVKDLAMFSKISDDIATLGAVFGINREIPNSTYDYHKYKTNINQYLKGVVDIESFVTMPINQRMALIDQLETEINDSQQLVAESKNVTPQIERTINVLQIINDNEHMMSYIESGAFANKEMQQMSKMYNTISRISDRVATQLERPMSERFYKDLNNFVYGLAVDDYLSIDGGRKIVMTRKGIKRTYNLGKTKASAGELGRIEFMLDFPYYFKNDLIPRRENTLQNYMTVEILGKESKEYYKLSSIGVPQLVKTPDETVPVLKTIGDFRIQSPEKKIEIMSMMQNLEESSDNKSDLGNYGDSSVKQMLFLYSLIKDKGGNSPTSYTALFDADDFADFDDHMESWESDYDLNNEKEMDDLIAQFKGFSTNAPTQGVIGEINIHPKYRFAIPYKNDKTANDLSDLSETVTRLNERKVSKNDELVKAINDGVEAIITTMKESGPKAKKGMRIEEILAAGGYTLNEEISGEGEYVWEKTSEENTTAINEYFSSTTDTFNVQMNDDMSDLDDDADLPSDADGTSDVPFSRFDFEESEKRRVYASKTNTKVLSTLASIISNNTGVDIEVLSSSQINQKYGNKFSQLRGFVAKDGVPVINSDVAGLDTPMHEMGHLWMQALKGSNLSLYNSIIEQVSEHEMMDKVAEQYPELEGTALAEEVFSTLFGLSQQDKALSSYNRNFLTKMRDTLMRFMEWLNETMNGLFGITPRTDDTLIDVMNKIGDRMLSSSIFNFSGSDLDTLSTLGMTSKPLSSELRAIQGELARKGLMETIC
jgi:hypothetical protein